MPARRVLALGKREVLTGVAKMYRAVTCKFFGDYQSNDWPTPTC